MLKVGLTGGIGSGKSAVAARLAEHGAVVIDADQLARAVVEPGTPGLAAVLAEFGDGVRAADGSLDRAQLASVVFSDQAALHRLNAIVHPLVSQRTADLVAGTPPDAVVVHGVPLLAENRLAPRYHLVVVVESAESLRIGRLVRLRGMTETDARARVRAQATDEQRRAVADALLVNDGTLDALNQAVDRLWQERIKPYADNLRLGHPSDRPEVVIGLYDPTWPQQYERLAARLGLAVGDLRVDHIGSTAVPGLAAKDVIDLQVTVDTLDQADALQEAIEQAGFPRVRHIKGDTPREFDLDPTHWAKRYHGAADPGRPAHVHLRASRSAGWRYALLFRDWLRAHPAEAAAYADEKRRLAAAHPQRAAYTEAKEPWFDGVLPRAEEWARDGGWQG